MADGRKYLFPCFGETIWQSAMIPDYVFCTKDYVTEFISKAQRNDNSSSIQSPACNSDRENQELKTLEDCLRFFSLPTLLKELEASLEDVRKRKITKKEHEDLFKEVDKKMQKLSLKYHPDKVSNRGGRLEEVATAQKLQSALNSTRTVLSILNKEFLEDLDIDHKYMFYSKLQIANLGNEEQIRKQISDVLYKTILLSEIKQVNIIAHIRKFLTESQASLRKFVTNISEFKKHRSYALYHLKKCIQGYEKLLAEFKTIDGECKRENLVHITSVVNEMERKSLEEYNILRELKRVAKISLKNHFQIFSCTAHMDGYLILPFVYYVNALLISSLMLEEKSGNLFNRGSSYVHLPQKSELEVYLNQAAESALSLNKDYHSVIKGISEEKKKEKEVLKQVLRKHLTRIKDNLEKRFRIEDYEEGGNKKYLLDHYAKIMSMSTDIENTMLNIVKDMTKYKEKDERTHGSYQNIMMNTNMLKKRTEESLKQSKLLNEKVVKVLQNTDEEEKGRREFSFKGINKFEKQIEESLKQNKLLSEEILKTIQNTDEEKKGREEISFKGTDEFDKEFEEILKQSNLLHEKVSKVLERRDEEIRLQNITDLIRTNELVKEITENFGKDERCPDQLPRDLQEKSFEEDRNGSA